MKESVIYQEILAEGEKIGEKTATERIALNLLSEGMSLEGIARVTQLTIAQVQTLQSKLESETENI